MAQWQRMLVSGRYFIDFSEFIRMPIRSGIQRIVAELCRYVAGEMVPVCILDSETIAILDDRIFDNVAQFFENSGDVIGLISKDLHSSAFRASGVAGDIQRAAGEALFSMSVQEFAEECGAFFTPELFFEEKRMAFYREFLSISPDKLFISVNDFIPWLHPEYFPQFNVELSENLMEYIHMLRRAQHVSFISETTKKDFTKRIARHENGDFRAFQLGADGLGQAAPQAAGNSRHFVVLGTVEPRKKSIFILNLFKELVDEGVELSLTFLGKAQQLSDAELEYFEETVAATPGFSWKSGLDDGLVRQEILQARACLYVSEMEGAGLPPLESLALGVPVIVSNRIPSLSGLPSAGQVRIDPDDREQLRAAVLHLSNEGEANALRREISLLELPTWKQFARATMDWIRHATDKPGQSKPLPLRDVFRVIRGVRRADSLSTADRIFELCRVVLGKTPAGSDLQEWDVLVRSGLSASQIAIKILFRAARSGALEPAAADRLLDALQVSEYIPDDAPEFVDRIEKNALDAKLMEALAALDLDDLRFVDFAYSFCLGRGADHAGRDHYGACLRSGEKSRFGIILDLIGTPEMEGRPDFFRLIVILKWWIEAFDRVQNALAMTAGDEQFISAAYLAVVGRRPDSEGAGEYLMHLRKGLPREMMLLSLLTSEEGLRFYSDREVIERLGAWLIGRMRNNPSAAAYVQSNWLEAISGAPPLTNYLEISERKVLKEGDFTLSDVKKLLAIKGNSAFLKACYSRLFRRQADEDGLKCYKEVLSRQSRAFVLSDLLRSSEFHDKGNIVSSGVFEFLESL